VLKRRSCLVNLSDYSDVVISRLMKLFQDPLTTALWPNSGHDPKVSKHWCNCRKLPNYVTSHLLTGLYLNGIKEAVFLLLGRVGWDFIEKLTDAFEGQECHLLKSTLVPSIKGFSHVGYGKISDVSACDGSYLWFVSMWLQSFVFMTAGFPLNFWSYPRFFFITNLLCHYQYCY